MWFVNRKKDMETIEILRENTLTIETKNGVISFRCSPFIGKSKIEPWINFYKWFFGRSSDFYVAKFKDGERMIRRDDIVSFSVKITKVTKSCG